MKRTLDKGQSRVLAAALIALTAGLTAGRAGTIEPTASLPPTTGVYAVPNLCMPPLCFSNIGLADFALTSDTFSGGNESVQGTATLSSIAYQDIAGNPGALLGPVSLGGTIDITWFGRDSSGELGTFAAQITDFDFSGTINGHTIESVQDSSNESTGSATITAVSGGFQVTSFFDVFGDLSIDGSALHASPERVATLTSQTPEPGTAGLALLSLLGFGGIAFRRRLYRRF